jgi:hypothetical protein
VKGSFEVGDGGVYQASATNIKSVPAPQLIINTVRTVVEQQQYFSDVLWKKAILAKEIMSI